MPVPRVAKAQPWAGIGERFQRYSFADESLKIEYHFDFLCKALGVLGVSAVSVVEAINRRRRERKDRAETNFTIGACLTAVSLGYYCAAWYKFTHIKALSQLV